MSEVIKMTQDEMSGRVARFAEQTGNSQLMITQSIPGFKRDIYSIIGKGVSEDSGTQPGIVDSEGFNVAYVGAPPDNGSAMHTHDKEIDIPFVGNRLSSSLGCKKYPESGPKLWT